MRFRSSVFSIAGLAVLLGTSTIAHADTITQFTFNNVTTPTTAVNSGNSVALIGGTTATFAAGSPSDSSSSPNQAYNVTNFPAASAANQSAGLEFTFNTTGYDNISLSFDQRLSNTASAYYAIQYSTDGGSTYNTATNVTAGTIASGATGSASVVGSGASTLLAYTQPTSGTIGFFQGNTVNFSTISSANNNATLKVRIVSSFAPSTSSYAAIGDTSNYGTSGTSRFDYVTLSGTLSSSSVVPEAGTATLVLPAVLSVLGVVAVRRRRTA